MHIAVVGAGAAAVALLDHLAAGAAPPGAVTVLEPSPHLWRGRPYAPDLDTVLVNAPPSIMSIRHSDAGHYAAWLGERGPAHLDELLGQPLVPRATFGDYLAETAGTALATLRGRGWRVRVLAGRVTSVARAGGRLLLRTEQGQEHAADHAADHVVLCVGGGTPPDHYGLAGTPGFVADPYPLAGTLERIPAESGVAVVGSGLTAVDVVVALAGRGHTGPIRLVSRSGLLPHVWQRPLDHRPIHLTVERVAALHRENGAVTVDDLVRLLRAEVGEAGEDFDDFAAGLLAARHEDPVRRLRRQLAAVGDGAIARRVLQMASHTVGAYAWRLLAESERARLRRHFRLATSVVSPMVPVNASVLLRLADSGQLTMAAGVRGIEASGGRFRLRGDDGVWTADTVVNAVNAPPQSVPPAARELVASLVTGGLAAAPPAGGIVPVDPRLHVAGDLAGGGSFVTSGIPGVAARAASAAEAALAG